MAIAGIPAIVRSFILANFDSIELLEVLLLLREDRERLWTTQELNREIRTDPMSIGIRTKTLVAKGFIAESHKGSETFFKYSPHSEECAQLTDEVAFYYKKWRVSVIELIFSRPSETIQSFADAFKIRKD